MRRELGELSDADSISAGEMLRAMALYRQMAATAEPAIAALPLDGVTPATTAPAAPVPTVAAASDGDATVTPIDVGQRKRGDGPLRP